MILPDITTVCVDDTTKLSEGTNPRNFRDVLFKNIFPIVSAGYRFRVKWIVIYRRKTKVNMFQFINSISTDSFDWLMKTLHHLKETALVRWSHWPQTRWRWPFLYHICINNGTQNIQITVFVIRGRSVWFCHWCQKKHCKYFEFHSWCEYVKELVVSSMFGVNVFIWWECLFFQIM